MCLIVVGNKNDVIKQKSILENAIKINHNGFGLMYFKDDNIISKKTLSTKFSDVENLIKSVIDDCDNKLALHFRFATEGVVDKINTHPIPILSKEKEGRAISLMHNSPMLPTALIDKDRSDTHQFVKYYLKPVLKSNPDLLYNQKWLEQLNRDCEGSRLVFCDAQNKGFVYVNKKLWTKKDKVWFSNDNSFQTSSWGFGHGNYSSNWNTYKGYNYDADDVEDIQYKTKQIPNDKQTELFNLDDFLDMPLDDELLLNMNEDQLKQYVVKNSDEVINFLTEFKYGLYQ